MRLKNAQEQYIFLLSKIALNVCIKIVTRVFGKNVEKFKENNCVFVFYNKNNLTK